MTYKTSWPSEEPAPWWRGQPVDRGARGRSAPGGQSIAAWRPASPGQLALIGAGLWLAGALVPLLHALAAVGVVLLVVAGLSLFLRPRTRTMYWRGRRIDLQNEPSVGERVYRLIYRAR
ncbi:MAG TPA: hypothetical protein VK066_26035 [Chloroflexota bacterium]|nr:hypothetical protein [Chloroflexota bacterium]